MASSSRPLPSSAPPPWPKIEGTLTGSGSLFELFDPPINSNSNNQDTFKMFRFAHPQLRAVFENVVVREHASSDADYLVIHVPGRRNSTRLKFHEMIAAVASSLRSLMLTKYGGESGGRTVLYAGQGSKVGVEWLAAWWSAAILGCEVGIVDEPLLFGSDGDEESRLDAGRELVKGAKARFVEAERAARMGFLGSIPAKSSTSNKEGEVEEPLLPTPAPASASTLIRPVATVLLPPPGAPTFSAYPSSYHLSAQEGAERDNKKPKPVLTPWPEYRHEAGNPFWTDIGPFKNPLDPTRTATISAHLSRSDPTKPVVVPIEFSQQAWAQYAHAALYNDVARRVRRQEFVCAPISYMSSIKGMYGNKRNVVLAVLPPLNGVGIGVTEVVKLLVECGVTGSALHLFTGDVSAEEVVKVVEREKITRIAFIGRPLALPSIASTVSTVSLTLLCTPNEPIASHLTTFNALGPLTQVHSKPGRADTDLRVDLASPYCLCLGTSIANNPHEMRFRLSPGSKGKLVNGRLFVRSNCSAQGGAIDTGLDCSEDGEGGYVVKFAGGDSKL